MNRVQSTVFENGYAERLIGSIRRKCLDHVVVVGERDLRHIVPSILQRGQNAPIAAEGRAGSRDERRTGRARSSPILG
jgi:hypothetical protein